MVETIEWKDGAPGEAGSVIMIDQRKLPRQEIYVECHNYLEVADAIKTMVIRGAPAVSVAAGEAQQGDEDPDDAGGDHAAAEKPEGVGPGPPREFPR